MKRIAVLVFLGVFAFTGGWGCSGSSPTDTKLDPTPVPTPVVTPTPTPTPKPGTTPTPTPVPVISISVMSLNPPAGSNTTVGQSVFVTFRVTGTNTGLVIIKPSEDGVTPSPNEIFTTVDVVGQVALGRIISTFSMRTTGRTTALLFYYTPYGGEGVPIPGSTYQAVYNWGSPTLFVSIGPGGVCSPRDSGTIPPGTAITYRNDDTDFHMPWAPDPQIGRGMVTCPGLTQGAMCTSVVYNTTGQPLRVSVADALNANNNTAEIHSFTVSP